MKTRIIWCTFFLIIGLLNLHGQKTGSNYIHNLSEYQPNLTGELFRPDLPIDEITYFNSEWLSADIYLSNGEIAKNKLLKYNGLLDELFWLEPKSKNIIKLDKEAVLQFHFQDLNDDSTVFFRRIKVKKNSVSDSSDVFGQVIFEGKLSLFVQHTYKFSGTELSRRNGLLLENNVYEKIPVYIFMFTNNKTLLTKVLNRKSLYSFFPEHQDQIKNFFRQLKHSKIDSYDDISSLMIFLNSIVFQ